MAESIEKYKMYPVNGVSLKKMIKFLESDEPFTKLITVDFLPQGMSTGQLRQQLVKSITQLRDKYYEYINLGLFDQETRLVGLGQLSKDSRVIEDYIKAASWKRITTVESYEKQRPTVRTLKELMDKWIRIDRARIGMERVSVKPELRVDEKKKEIYKFYKSDMYNKPIAKVRGLEPLARGYIKETKISVAQAETILNNIIARYNDDNQMVVFRNKDEQDAYRLINYVSNLNTALDQTPKGVKMQMQNLYRQYKITQQEQKIRKNLDLEFETKEQGLELLQEHREQERIVREQILNRDGDMDELNQRLAQIREQIEIVNSRL